MRVPRRTESHNVPSEHYHLCSLSKVWKLVARNLGREDRTVQRSVTVLAISVSGGKGLSGQSGSANT